MKMSWLSVVSKVWKMVFSEEAGLGCTSSKRSWPASILSVLTTPFSDDCTIFLSISFSFSLIFSFFSLDICISFSHSSGFHILQPRLREYLWWYDDARMPFHLWPHLKRLSLPINRAKSRWAQITRTDAKNGLISSDTWTNRFLLTSLQSAGVARNELSGEMFKTRVG